MAWRRVPAFILRWLAPGLGYCHRCRRPWNCVEPHATRYTDSKSCFPLCESCWRALSPPDRLPYYASLWRVWMTPEGGGPDLHEPGDWDRLQRAVMAGR